MDGAQSLGENCHGSLQKEDDEYHTMHIPCALSAGVMYRLWMVSAYDPSGTRAQMLFITGQVITPMQSLDCLYEWLECASNCRRYFTVFRESRGPGVPCSQLLPTDVGYADCSFGYGECKSPVITVNEFLPTPLGILFTYTLEHADVYHPIGRLYVGVKDDLYANANDTFICFSSFNQSVSGSEFLPCVLSLDGQYQFVIEGDIDGNGANQVVLQTLPFILDGNKIDHTMSKSAVMLSRSDSVTFSAAFVLSKYGALSSPISFPNEPFGNADSDFPK